MLDQLFRAAALRITGIRLKTEWSPLQRYGSGYAEAVRVRFESEQSVHGFAMAFSRHLAVLKALMEAMESLAVQDNHLNIQSRSGLAAHLDFKEASDKAYEELIERDAFLLHWLAEMPGRRLDVVFTKGGLTQARAVQLFSADPQISVVMVGKKSAETGCWNFGLGAAKNLNAAIKKASLEFLGSCYAHLDPESPGRYRCYAEAFLKTDTPEARARLVYSNHHLATREPAVSGLMERILCGKKEEFFHAVISQGMTSEQLRKQTVMTPLKVRSSRYHVVYAENPGLLPLAFGELFHGFRARYLENRRLSLLLPSSYDFHPDGKHLLHPLD